jgi:hypothetical protein
MKDEGLIFLPKNQKSESRIQEPEARINKELVHFKK